MLTNEVSDRFKIEGTKRPRFFHRTKVQPKVVSLVPNGGYTSVRAKIDKGSQAGFGLAGLPIDQERIPRLDEDGSAWEEFQSIGMNFYSEKSRLTLVRFLISVADKFLIRSW
jgi:hypothetical protein